MGRRSLFTSESVTEGHPDKLADQVSDAVLDSILADDPDGRVACETLVTTGVVMVAGEISTRTYVDVPKVVRDTVNGVGYTDAKSGMDGDTCGVIIAIQEQSPDIAIGVDHPLEEREGEIHDPYDLTGAGDQGMMIGYACIDTEELMPMPIAVAHRLAKRLADVRKAGVLPYLRPDGKTQVTIEYEEGRPVRVHTVVVSAQHGEDTDIEGTLVPDVVANVIEPVVREMDLDAGGVRILVNPTGRFEVGGPKADTGLTGRKIMVDSYGSMAPHGGGCFSGKDATKVDRSAAYMGRYVAKNVIAAGLADRLQLQVAYAIGAAHPVSLSIETFGTASVDPSRLESVVGEVFDFRPAAIIAQLDLKRPIYRETAAYGHFGRKGFPWEETDRADDLRRAFE
ncbi:methionine adenosyltransferase [soil metagenome]